MEKININCVELKWYQAAHGAKFSMPDSSTDNCGIFMTVQIL